MALAKPINKYIDYIDAPEDTFEQYVEKGVEYNFRCVFANLDEYEVGRFISTAPMSSLPAPSIFPRAL